MTNPTNEQVCELYRSIPNTRKVAAQLGISRHRVRTIIAGGKPKPVTLTKRMPKEMFISAFDLVSKVRTALRDLGSDAIVDNDLRCELNIPAQQWANIRNMEEFSKNQITHKGKLWWACATTISAAKAYRDQV